MISKQQLQALMFGEDAILEEDSQNLILEGDYSDGYDDSEEFYSDEEEENNYTSKSGRQDDLDGFKKRGTRSDDDILNEEKDYKMFLQSKYDQRTKIMEEEEKKRKDPNRDFVINEGQSFLTSMKFFNPQIDVRNGQVENLNDNLIKMEGGEIKLFDETSKKTSSIREHWLIHDRS